MLCTHETHQRCALASPAVAGSSASGFFSCASHRHHHQYRTKYQAFMTPINTNLLRSNFVPCDDNPQAGSTMFKQHPKVMLK
jgi:hypothetical protein